jgi:hypothetical protein
VKDERTEKEKKKSAVEKERRSNGRYHVGRISRLFRAGAKPWSRRDVLGLSELTFCINGLD